MDSSITSYTHCIWQRVENIKTRCWTVPGEFPVEPCSEHPHVSPDDFIGSHTARFACSWRASAHALRFGPDSLAHLFIDSVASKRLGPAAERFRQTGYLPVVYRFGNRDAVVAQQAIKPHDEVDMLSYIQVRTCFMDDAVTHFLEHFEAPDTRILGQVVLLGAGFDTRFYRINFPDTVRLLEVDKLETQAFKRGVLGKASHANYFAPQLLSRVRFVPLNLICDSLLSHLESHGFDERLRTLIVCEGVLPYLELGSVEQMLRMVSDLDCPAALAFDFVSADFKASRPVRLGLARLCEPWTFVVDAADMTRLCTAAGLTLIDELSVLAGLKRYLPVTPTGESVGFGSSEIRFMIAANSRFIDCG